MQQQLVEQQEQLAQQEGILNQLESSLSGKVVQGLSRLCFLDQILTQVVNRE